MTDVKRYAVAEDIPLVPIEGGSLVYYSDHQAALAARDAKVRELVERWREEAFVRASQSASLKIDNPAAKERKVCAEELHTAFKEIDNNSRPLNLTWKTNLRDGKEHKEWTAPCGCAYHPEPYPHVHQCAMHKQQPENN